MVGSLVLSNPEHKRKRSMEDQVAHKNIKYYFGMYTDLTGTTDKYYRVSVCPLLKKKLTPVED